jgi:hypothetical protein
VKIIALLEMAPGRKPEELAPLRADEAAVVWSLYTKGVIRNMHYRTDRPAAVLELETADVQCARRALQGLPAVEAGIIEVADLIPTAPYNGFEALFKQ